MRDEEVQNETTFTTWKFCYGKLNDNMLQGGLQREREREESASERKTGDYTWPHVKLVNGFIYVSSLATTTS